MKFSNIIIIALVTWIFCLYMKVSNLEKRLDISADLVRLRTEQLKLTDDILHDIYFYQNNFWWEHIDSHASFKDRNILQEYDWEDVFLPWNNREEALYDSDPEETGFYRGRYNE